MANIIIGELDIDIVQKVTGIKITDAQAIEVTGDGIKWNGALILLSGESLSASVPLRNYDVARIINENKQATEDELDVEAQAIYAKNYMELTVLESKHIQTVTISTKIVTSLDNTEVTGITIDDPATLIAGIVGAFISAGQ